MCNNFVLHERTQLEHFQPGQFQVLVLFENNSLEKLKMYHKLCVLIRELNPELNTKEEFGNLNALRER